MARNSFACAAGERSDTSSRNNVPSCACSNLPRRPRTPVAVRSSMPNSSASSSGDHCSQAMPVVPHCRSATRNRAKRSTSPRIFLQPRDPPNLAASIPARERQQRSRAGTQGRSRRGIRRRPVLSPPRALFEDCAFSMPPPYRTSFDSLCVGTRSRTVRIFLSVPRAILPRRDGFECVDLRARHGRVRCQAFIPSLCNVFRFLRDEQPRSDMPGLIHSAVSNEARFNLRPMTIPRSKAVPQCKKRFRIGDFAKKD